MKMSDFMGFIKKSGAMCLAIGLLFTGSFSAQALTDDEYVEKGFGGTTVAYKHWLTYKDARCGMTTQAWVSAMAKSPISKIGYDYTVYDLYSKPIGGNGVTANNSKGVSEGSGWKSVIENSHAKFTFENSGQSWYPQSYVDHCSSWSNTKAIDNLVVEHEANIQKRKQENNKRFVNDTKNNNEIIEKALVQFKENKGTLEQFGLAIEDFKASIVKVEGNSNKIKDEQLDLDFKFENPSNMILVHFNTDKKGEKEGEKVNVTGYVLFSKENGRIETGISTKLVE